MGAPKSPEHRAAISRALKGKTKSESHRAAISAARRHQYDQTPWTPQKSRDAVRRAVRRGELPPAGHCVRNSEHAGPYGYDHCGDPPYAFENRYEVQSVCNPCHQTIEAERRAGRGYTNRSGVEVTCSRCDASFYVQPSRAKTARWCSWACRYA